MTGRGRAAISRSSPTRLMAVALLVIIVFATRMQGTNSTDDTRKPSLRRRAVVNNVSYLYGNPYRDMPVRPSLSSSTTASKNSNTPPERDVSQATTGTAISSTGSESDAAVDSDFLRATQGPFIKDCLTLLGDYAVDGKVNRQQYVGFLDGISKGSLSAQEFKDLPLFLSMIFFSASCSDGEDCVDGEPAITVPHYKKYNPQNEEQDEEERQHPMERNVGMNDVLCHQLKRYPFLEVIFPFQFLVRVSDDVSASELMLVNDTSRSSSRIVPDLELALDKSLLQGFNCSYIPGQPYKPKKMEGRKRRPVRDGRYRQPQPQDDCDFVVEVTVADAADYPCGFRDSCILVFSDVSIYAVLNESLDEATIRTLTTRILRDAINGNALSAHL